MDNIKNKFLLLISEANRLIDTTDFKQIEHRCNTILDICVDLIDVVNDIKKEKFLNTDLSLCNIVHTINLIHKLIKVRSAFIKTKIEYQLIPLIKETYYNFYYYYYVHNKDKDTINYYDKNQFIEHSINPYIQESSKTNKYKYDISLFILTHNKLEYTKQCIDSIMNFMPDNIKYELFFINNGSTDNITQRYLDSFHCEKTIDFKYNCFDDIRIADKIIEGKYYIAISNDIVLTKNAIANMYKAMENDKKIGMIVPTTPNVSNYQAIPSDYKSLEDLYKFSENNNKYDESRHEQRVRLCNPIAMYRSEAMLTTNGIGFIERALYYNDFIDDGISLRMRRKGYKLMLLKDAYCHHFGSVTKKETDKGTNNLNKSRELFKKRYNVDAWSNGFCFDYAIINIFNYTLKDNINILGINSGFGSNLLKIKEEFKANGNNKVKLHFALDINNKEYQKDLIYFGKVETNKYDILDLFNKKKFFNIILIEDNIKQTISPAILEMYLERIKSGILAIRAKGQDEMDILDRLKYNKKIKGDSIWYIWEVI